MITLKEINEAYRNGSEEEKQEFLSLILPDLIRSPIFNSPEFINAVETVMLASELKPIKRISNIETVLSLNDNINCEDHDYELTIPEKIEALKKEIQHIEYRPTESPQIELKPETKTGMRALHLITRLKDSGKKHFTHKEIKSILTSDLPEECKIDATCKNPRKTIKDVLNEAVSLCSDIFLDQKKHGHREWRIVLRS